VALATVRGDRTVKRFGNRSGGSFSRCTQIAARLDLPPTRARACQTQAMEGLWDGFAGKAPAASGLRRAKTSLQQTRSQDGSGENRHRVSQTGARAR